MSQITKPPRQLWKRGRWILSLCWTSWSVGVWWFTKRKIDVTSAVRIDSQGKYSAKGRIVHTKVGGFDLGPLTLEFREKWRKP